MRSFTLAARWAVTLVGAALSARAVPVPTFHKDVLPILQRHCQPCHRSGEAAPMAFIHYAQVRPWARAIKQSVVARKMPPWLAEAGTGEFQQEHRLSSAEVATLAAWADGGAPAGNSGDAPPPAQFSSGWTIGQPDLVLDVPPAMELPAAGTAEYIYLIIPTGLKQDRWVQRAEVHPSDRTVTHQVLAFLRPPGSPWLANYEPGVPFVPKRGGGDSNDTAELLVAYAPGRPAAVLPGGQARLVQAGSDVVLQFHYTANAKASMDRTQLGLIFSPALPQQRVMTIAASNTRFVIPPQTDNHRVDAQITLQHDAELVSMMPHLHLRGKDFEYRAVYPSGMTETLLRVPKFDFNWQLHYNLARPKLLPRGTRIECTAHFDNSANNPANPDPQAEVTWGRRSSEEMMIGWLDVAFPATLDPAKVIGPEKKARPGKAGR